MSFYPVIWSSLINHIAMMTTITSYQNIDYSIHGHVVTLRKGDLSSLKVYSELLNYVEGSPLTLCNHFTQHYRTFDTLSNGYY